MKPLDKPSKFAHDLCDWYRLNKRDLPFRKTCDPYKILVSEMMLQQTQMETVIPYYERFIERFPDVHALANADIAHVLKLWEGLGYYRRARYLHETANTIVRDYAGVFPTDINAIRKLKGLGRYTAGAVSAIAFKTATPAVDGNVMRVMTRLTMNDADIAKGSTIDSIETQLTELIVFEDASDFTQAMMEMGALVCQRNPKCTICPIRDHCHAFKTHTQNDYPVKASIKKKVSETYIVLMLKDHQGKILFTKRPEKGLLGGMLEIPQYQTDDSAQAIRQFEQTYGIMVNHTQEMFTINHVFTHKIWTMHIYHVFTREAINKLPMLDPSHLEEAISKAHRKILDHREK